MRYSKLDIDLSNKDISTIYAMGDIHGDFDSFLNEIKRLHFENCFIIICGDIGLGFYKEGYYDNYFSKLQKDLSKMNTYLICYRGNHDDPDYFKYHNYDNPFDINYPNIILLDDYSIVKFNDDYKALFIGGARSVDKQYRILNGWSHWDNENVINLDEDKLKRIINSEVNHVFTHTTCSYLDITDGKLPKDLIDNYIALGDKTLEDDIKNERILMNDIYNKISETNKISTWICGHFHAHSECEYNNTKFIILDMFRNNINKYNHNILETREYLKRSTKGDYYTIYEK